MGARPGSQYGGPANMTSRALLLPAALLLAATAHAATLRTGVASAQIATELNLPALSATLAGLTVLGIALGVRRRPGPDARAGATHRR